MTDALVLAVAVFAAVTAATLCLTAVLAPDRTVRARARALLLALVRSKNTDDR